MERLHDLFYVTVQGLRKICWSEIMLIMDNARSGCGKDNLTVALMHERFQGCEQISTADRLVEESLYRALQSRYADDGVRDARNREWFHADLRTALQPPVRGGDLTMMVELILDWYRDVASAVYGNEPKYVTVGAIATGRRIGRQWRHALLCSIRRRHRRMLGWECSLRDRSSVG